MNQPFISTNMKHDHVNHFLVVVVHKLWFVVCLYIACMDACDNIFTDHICGQIRAGHRAGPVMKTFTAISDIQCLHVCQSESCSSYNYQTTNKTCEVINVHEPTLTIDHLYDHVIVNKVRITQARCWVLLQI